MIVISLIIVVKGPEDIAGSIRNFVNSIERNVDTNAWKSILKNIDMPITIPILIESQPIKTIVKSILPMLFQEWSQSLIP